MNSGDQTPSKRTNAELVNTLNGNNPVNTAQLNSYLDSSVRYLNKSAMRSINHSPLLRSGKSVIGSAKKSHIQSNMQHALEFARGSGANPSG